MEDGRVEATSWRRVGVILLEDHLQFEATAFPNRPSATRNHAFPNHQVQSLRVIRVHSGLKLKAGDAFISYK